MAFMKVAPNIMTRNQHTSERWAPREYVKEAARKRRRAQDKRECNATAR